MNELTQGSPDEVGIKPQYPVGSETQLGAESAQKLGAWGVDVATHIAGQEHFNRDAADFSMRNTAGLFSGMQESDYAGLPVTTRQEIVDLARRSLITLHGERSREVAEYEAAAIVRPGDSVEFIEMNFARGAFNGLQQAIAFDQALDIRRKPERSMEIRGLVVDYAKTFAHAFFNLSVTSPQIAKMTGYFTNNLNAAAPEELRRYPETARSSSDPNGQYELV